ncbi:MAG: beta-ketoacyl-ACP synthase II [Lachnospiraceae bacterium]|nr:beta-ketoacyl-ACP synthase II [Lachnospiraceae bacterium]MDY5216606.1 beta-ketoacyl-ACP synthase II [Lachnospiraceae bacterium]
MRRVVVTGIGMITPVGNNTSDSWNAVKNGECGIGPITHYDTTGRKVTLAGEVKGYDPAATIDPKELRKMDRFVQFAMTAASEAVEASGIDFASENTERAGVIISSGIGGFATIQSEIIKGNEKGYDRVSPYFIPQIISNMAAGQIAIKYGLNGMCSCVVTACAGGTNAIGDAFHRIRDGYEDVMLCGGTEACITEIGIGGFTSMRALHTGNDPKRASIPFDKDRSGFVMGEGAAVLILEEEEHAKKRGAKIYGEVVGYGANCDANHITAPLEDGSMAAKCLTLALNDANVKPEEIDYINAHGTSTHLNDSGETKAIKLAFSEHAKKLMVSSTKSMTGHLLGAAGAVEAGFSVLALKDGFVPATIGYENFDEECDLDIVPNVGRNKDIRYAVSNSLGFGGHNACLVFKKY